MNIKITRTCGSDEKVSLPMKEPENNPKCKKCKDILILKEIVGTSVPPTAFEYYNTTTVLYLNDLSIETISPGAFESLNYLEELHLKKNKLKDILLGVVNSLENLKLIDLSFNNFNSMTRVSLEGTQQLRSVNLSSNYLINIKINEAWSNVTILDLSHNSISTVNLNELPSNVSVLNISSNRLTSFNVRKNYTVLDLGNNLLKTFDFGVLNCSVTKVGLGNNQITHVFATYCHIKEIDLSGNKLKSVPCDCSNASPQVEYLNLANNSISYLMPQTISELNSLKELHLELNKIQTIKAGTFASLQKLVYLNISHNVIETLELGSIDNIKNVEIFDISYNRLKQLKRYLMHTFANLKHLYLQYNNFTYLNATNLDEDLPKIWDINIVGNNLSCNNLWAIMRTFNKRPVHFPAGSVKNVTNVHGMPCYLLENSPDIDIAASMDELDVNNALSDYFNRDYRESNYYKFLEELRYSNMLIFNETHKMKEELARMFHSHGKPPHLGSSTSTGSNGYLITIVLFLLTITCFIALQGYILYSKFRPRMNDAERLL